MYLSIYLSIYLYVCLSVSLSLFLSVSVSVSVSLCLSLYLFTYLSAPVSVHQSDPPIHPPTSLCAGGVSAFRQNGGNAAKILSAFSRWRRRRPSTISDLAYWHDDDDDSVLSVPSQLPAHIDLPFLDASGYSDDPEESVPDVVPAENDDSDWELEEIVTGPNLDEFLSYDLDAVDVAGQEAILREIRLRNQQEGARDQDGQSSLAAREGSEEGAPAAREEDNASLRAGENDEDALRLDIRPVEVEEETEVVLSVEEGYVPAGLGTPPSENDSRGRQEGSSSPVGWRLSEELDMTVVLQVISDMENSDTSPDDAPHASDSQQGEEEQQKEQPAELRPDPATPTSADRAEEERQTSEGVHWKDRDYNLPCIPRPAFSSSAITSAHRRSFTQCKQQSDAASRGRRALRRHASDTNADKNETKARNAETGDSELTAWKTGASHRGEPTASDHAKIPSLATPSAEAGQHPTATGVRQREEGEGFWSVVSV